MVKMVVKAIKANKTGIYDKFITDKDKEVISQTILDSIWYPYEVYKKCLDALCKIDAKEKVETLIQWGRIESEKTMTSVYRLSIVEGNLKSAMEKYRRFHKRVFNFGDIITEFKSDNRMIVTYKDFDRDFKNFYFIALGWIFKFIELCIGVNPSYKLLKKSWEGADETKFEIYWEN